jgi:hypothetical protein
MSSTTSEPERIGFDFAWTADVEHLYRSWRDDALAEARAHRAMADRLGGRRIVVASLLLLASAFTVAAALALRFDPGAVVALGLGRDDVPIAIAVGASIATVFAIVQTFGRFAVRAERHRVAALRYDHLDRDMAATLALPRAARPDPDRTLGEAAERVRRYADASPRVRRARRRPTAAVGDREPSTRRATAFVMPPSTDAARA